jgi:23S rRNA (uracil1939-C5)-methyltransferase
VPTKLLYELGTVTLQDSLLGQQFYYDVDSFFQVNIPIFEKALGSIREHCDEPEVVDMYAGAGSIGLSVATRKVRLIESDPATAAMTRTNAGYSGLDTEIIETSTEYALDHITGDDPVIFDPPRAGLHKKVTERILETQPEKIIYLSCNPSTQARDLALLQGAYDVSYFEIFNFFPRTPHIETLAVLNRKH